MICPRNKVIPSLNNWVQEFKQKNILYIYKINITRYKYMDVKYVKISIHTICRSLKFMNL